MVIRIFRYIFCRKYIDMYTHITHNWKKCVFIIHITVEIYFLCNDGNFLIQAGDIKQMGES